MIDTAKRWCAALALATLAAAIGAAEPVFRDFDGNSRALDDALGGQWVLVMLWASDCHICNEETPGLTAFHERNRDGKVRMLGIALDGWDGRDAARAFVARHGVTFENLIAEFPDAAGFYEARTGRRWIGTPTFLLFDPDRTLRAQQVGAVEIEVIESFISRADP